LSGAQLLASANSCSSTGCSVEFDTEDVDWNGAYFVKTIITEDPTSAFDAKVIMWIEDVLGE